ncbi:MAG: tryptophan halogenase family protein [Gammaproteobacteria bacterium]
MSNQRHIVVVGGGTAGWMAANLLVRRWPSDQVKVTLVESPKIGTIGVGEGSTPAMRRFFELIDVADSDWMPQCKATYKVGIRFDGWSREGGVAQYRHPFFSQPDTFAHRAFLTNCRTRRLGLSVKTQPDAFFLNAQLAKDRLAPITPPNFPFHVDYGYHFDAGRLGRFLSELGVSRGVNHVRANILEARRDAHGDIAELVTDIDEPITGDFFIDCSGFAAVLMHKTLGVGFESFADGLFNDAAVVLPGPAQEAPVTETVSTALSAGWRWRIPLTHRYGNGYVYSSQFLSADQAETELRSALGDTDGRHEARHLKMRIGQSAKHWHKNCLALGLSQGFLEPLEATALLLVQVTLERFMAHYESTDMQCARHGEFNADIRQRFDGVRDYIVAHYKLNTRTDSDYWIAARDNPSLSDALRELLEAWYRREDISPIVERHYATSHFNTLSWHCLLAGYGAFPPLADDQPGRGDLFVDQNVAAFMQGCALNFSPPA